MILSGCQRVGVLKRYFFLHKKTLLNFTFTAIHYLPHIYPHKPLSIKHIKLYNIIKYRQPFLFPHSTPHKNFLYAVKMYLVCSAGYIQKSAWVLRYNTGGI